MFEKWKKYILKSKVAYITQRASYMAVILNVFFLLYVFLFFDLKYETNDDSTMALIAYGASTNYYSTHLVFINIIVGAILKILLSAVPFIPWYPIFMYLLLFLSYCVISYCLIKQNSLYGSFISIVVLVYYGYYTYTSLQFTEVSAVLTIAGISLLFLSIEDIIHKKRRIIMSVFLLILGAAYRFHMFCAVFIVMSGYGIYQLIKYYRMKDRRKIIRYVIIFCFVIATCFCVELLDKYEYNRKSVYREYIEFNSYRAILLDHGFPDYEDHEDVYQSLNISNEDLDLFRSWDFADPDVFSKEALSELAEIKRKEYRKVNSVFLEEFFSWFPKELLKYNWISAALIIVFISLMLYYVNIIWIGYEVFVLSCLQLYFFYMERYLQGRVDIGLFFAASIVIAMISLHYIPLNEKSNKALIMVSFVIILTLIPGWYQNNKRNEDTLINKERAEELLALLNEDKEKLYLCASGSVTSYSNAFGIWDVPPLGCQDNIYNLGGWRVNSPFTNQILEIYNVSNPFVDVINNSNIYLIDNNHINAIVEYIRRHYYENAYAVLVKQIYGTSIYSIRTDPININMSSCKLVPADLQHGFDIAISDEEMHVMGYAYMNEVSSYDTKAYVLLEDIYGDLTCYQMTQSENTECIGDMNGQYSFFSFEARIDRNNFYKLKIVYEVSGSLYCVYEEDINM